VIVQIYNIIIAYITITILSGMFLLNFELVFNGIMDRKWINGALKKGKYAGMTYTSLWMGLVGAKVGLMIDAFYHIPMFNRMPMLFLILSSGAIITAIELGCGYILNIKIKCKIWDYSNSYIGKVPVHFLGQIDIWHSLGWVAISPIVYWLDDRMNYYILKQGALYGVFENYVRIITDFIG
jgi:uncharacterized membrane protein